MHSAESDLLSPQEISSAVETAAASTPVLDMHTHLFAPGFSGLLQWGIDDLLTYHYLEAELFRHTDVTPEAYFALRRPAQADLIWRTMFVERAPVSESCRGVIAVLSALGLDTRARDLGEARGYFRSVKAAEHVGRVLELAGVRSVVMTNDPLDPAEAPWWQNGHEPDGRFHAAIRLDRLFFDLDGNREMLARVGCDVSGGDSSRSFEEIRRLLERWNGRMHPVYMAVSLADTFRFPAEDFCTRLLRESVLPACREVGIPLALMIGVRRQVNPRLRLAGDSVGPANLSSLERLCCEHPDNRFLVTVLSRENQHQLCVLARKFANLMPFGCWWFLNNPSIVEEMTRERVEMLGFTFVPQHSDARVLEQLIYKWRNTRRTLAGVFAASYRLLAEDGRPVRRAEIEADVARAFAGTFERFCNLTPGS